MSFLSKLRIPYSSDLVYGFLLLALLMVPTSVAPQFTDQALLFPDPLESVKVVVWSILVGLSMILLARRTTMKTVLPKAIIYLLFLLLGYILVTLPFSYDKVNSIIGVTMRMNSSLWFFTLWACWIGLLSIVGKQKFQILLRVALITGAIVTVLGIIQSYGIGFYDGVFIVVRQLIPSFLGNPNFTAMFLVGMVPLTVWMIFKEQHRYWRLLYIFFAGCFIWGMVLFTSRAALLGAILALVISVVIGVLNRQWKMVVFVFSGLVLLSVISVFYFQVSRPELGDGDLTDQSATERYYAWNHAAHFITQRPLTGSGPGNYFIAYRQNDRPELAGTGWFDDPHNLVLYLGASAGLPVAVIFLVIVGLAIWTGFQQSILRRTAVEPGIWMAAIVSWLVASSFGPVTTPSWFILGFFIVGLYYSAGVADREIKSKRVFLGSAIIGTILLFAGLLFTTSEILAWQGHLQLAKGNLDKSISLMNTAVTLNPANTAAIQSVAIVNRLDKNYDETDKALEQVTRLHPRSSAILQATFQEYLVLWNLTKDDYYKQKAYELMEQYRKSNPNYFITYRDIATGYMSLEDFPKAVEAARTEVIMANQNYQAWVLLAQAYQLNGQREQMMGAFREAYRLHPSGIVGKVLRQAEKEPDINKIVLPYKYPTFED